MAYNVQWFTHPSLFEAMNITFDMDPAHPGPETVAYNNFTTIYTEADDGLVQPWSGSVWLSPPYPTEPWVDKMVSHHSGILMLINRTAEPAYQTALKNCDSVLIMQYQMPFLRADGSEVTPDIDLSLFAFDVECTNCLFNMNYGPVLTQYTGSTATSGSM